MAYPVTLNGRTYTLADFEGTNYVDGLPDAFEDFVTHAGDIYNDTSSTSNAIGTGSKTFTVSSAKPYQAGTPLRIADSADPSTNFMDAVVTSYSGTTLVVNSIGYGGSGTKTSWTINIGGAKTIDGTLGLSQGGSGATSAADARTNFDVYSKSESDSRFLNVSGEASDVVITGSFTSPGIDDNASSTAITIDSSGNVGIGNIAPSYLLDLFKSASTVARIRNTAATGGTPSTTHGEFVIESTDGNMGMQFLGSTTADQRILFSDTAAASGQIVYNHTSNYMALSTNGGERLRIDSSGRVGINTSAPDTLFTVNGQAIIGDLVAGSANLTNFLSGTPPQLIAGWSIPAVTWTPTSWTEAVFTRDGDMAIDILAANTSSSIINFSDTDDENVGQIHYDHTTNHMKFDTNAAERMRIDSVGHVAVGTTTTGDASFTIATSSSGVTPNTTGDDLFIESSGNTGMTIGSGSTSLGRIYFGDSGSAIAGRISYDHSDNSLFFGTNGTAERMTITNTGRIVVASVAPTSDGYIQVPVGSTALGAWVSNSGSTSSRLHMRFENPNGVVGSISTSGSSTAFTTTSDYRLKENVTGITDGIERVKQLNPSRFNFIADPDTTVDGFVAHEVSDIVPESVQGEKDAVDADGNPEYQGIDQSKLVPVLTAALQEALTKIESLEARIVALETA